MGRLVATRRRWLWSELRTSPEYRGHWVALDQVSYGAAAEPIEGVVVDHDEDLTALCGRVQKVDRTSCSILFCDERG